MAGVRYDKPDTGYAWWILAACFTLQALMASGIVTFGMFLVEYLEYFGQGKARTSAIGATMFGSLAITGVLIGPLVKVFGPKRMTQIGTILVTGGFVLSSLTPNFYVLYVTQGIITGVGYCCLVTSVCVVQYFFDKRRGLATAVSTVGLSFGIFFWSLVTPRVIELYAYKGALLIVGGIHLNGLVVAAVFREPRFEPTRDESEQNVDGQTYPVMLRNGDAHGHITCYINDVTKSNLHINTEPPNVDVREKSRSCSDVNNAQMSKVKSRSGSDITNVHKRKLNLQRHGIESCADFNSNNTLYSSVLGLAFHLPDTPTVDCTNDSKSKNTTRVSKLEQTRTALKLAVLHLLDISLFKNHRLVLYYIAMCLATFGNLIPVTFIPIRIAMTGGTKEQAAMLVTALGAGSGVGRIFFGWIGDRPWANRYLMYSIANIMAGLLSMASSFISSYDILIMYCVSFSILEACYVSVQSTLLGDIVGMADLPKAVGHSVCLAGVALLGSTSAAGVIMDKTGSATLPFVVMGSIHAAGGCVGCAVYWLSRKTSQTREMGVPT